MSQNSPSDESQVKFVYVRAGASLPSSLESNAIYFDENTQRLVVSGVSIYNPVVYDPSSAEIPASERSSPRTILLTQEEYSTLLEQSRVDANTLYLIYEEDVETGNAVS